MTINYNKTFKQLLTEFNLPEDLNISVKIPTEVQKILPDKILTTEFGITLKSFNKLYKAEQPGENQSIVEDNENHFHVDWHIEPEDAKNALKLGIKTLTALAEKFLKEKLTGIRFTYTFQTPELGRLWAKENNLEEDDDEHFISDRLSFYTRRANEELLDEDNFDNKYWATLIIDI